MYMDTTEKKKKILSEEALEKLKIARQKALETKKKLAVIRDAEKTKKKNELDTKYGEAKQVLEASAKASLGGQDPLETLKHVQEPKTSETKQAPKVVKKPTPPRPKKVIRKVIEITDSESDSESESESESEVESECDYESESEVETESESEVEEEYVVKKKPKRKVAIKKKPIKQARKSNALRHSLTQPSRNYTTRELTPAVARGLLQDKVLNDAQKIAFNSLFPYHNF